MNPRIEPIFVHLIEHVDWWRPLGETSEGRAFFEAMRQDLARQLARLRASDIPWLLDPEQWPGRMAASAT